MEFEPTPISGAWVIRPQRHQDARGYFARTYCEASFAERGLHTHWPQNNLSFNAARGTLRGMHYNVSPYEEIKLVRCVQGSIYDVIIDLRPDSTSYRQHFGVRLSAENGAALYIPGGCAHGFLTLEADTSVHYHMGRAYVAEAARGLRWDDPAFSISWPEPVRVIAERDAGYADFAG